MLIEAMLHLTALRCPEAGPLGLVGSAVGLWSRARRCRATWAPHHARCVAFVERAIADLPEGGTALVLGSGLSREIALPALARKFDRVLLLDAVHLLPARMEARRHGAETFAVDLSGWGAALLGRTGSRLDPLAPWRDEPIAFVLSANLLSQMPRAPARWAENHEGRTPFGANPERTIASDHLTDLLSVGVPACLLTDVAYRRIDRQGATLDETDLLGDVVLPDPDETWDWTVAPLGELDRRATYLHRMHAYRDLRSHMSAGSGREPIASRERGAPS